MRVQARRARCFNVWGVSHALSAAHARVQGMYPGATMTWTSVNCLHDSAFSMYFCSASVCSATDVKYIFQHRLTQTHSLRACINFKPARTATRWHAGRASTSHRGGGPDTTMKTCATPADTNSSSAYCQNAGVHQSTKHSARDAALVHSFSYFLRRNSPRQRPGHDTLALKF